MYVWVHMHDVESACECVPVYVACISECGMSERDFCDRMEYICEIMSMREGGCV